MAGGTQAGSGLSLGATRHNGLRTAQRTTGGGTHGGLGLCHRRLGATHRCAAHTAGGVLLFVVVGFVVVGLNRCRCGGRRQSGRCRVKDFHTATAHDAIHQQGRIGVHHAVGLDDAHGLSRGHFEHDALFGTAIGEEHHIGEFCFGEHGFGLIGKAVIVLLRTSRARSEGKAEREAEYLFHCRWAIKG